MHADAVIPEERLTLVSKVARTHAKSKLMGQLAFAVMTRQAEGRVLFAGKPFVEKQTKQIGLEREDGETELGNLIAILERGPSDGEARALVMAFALVGFEASLQVDIPDGDDDELESDRPDPTGTGPNVPAAVARFAKHAEWLELCTAYPVFSLVDLVLSEDTAGFLWRAVAARVAAADARETHVNDRATGRNTVTPKGATVDALTTMRLIALSESPHPDARAGLRSLSRTLHVPLHRATSRLLLHYDHGGQASEAGETGVPFELPPLSFAGQPVPGSMRPMVRVVRLVTGWALLSWLFWGLGWLVGLRRRVRLVSDSTGVRIEREARLLGYVLRRSERHLPTSEVVEMMCTRRLPLAHALIGVIGLGLGIFLGGTLLFEGVRTAETHLLLVGAGVAAAGAILDLLLGFHWPKGTRPTSDEPAPEVDAWGVDYRGRDRAAATRTTFWLRTRHSGTVAITGVPYEAAQRVASRFRLVRPQAEDRADRAAPEAIR